MTATRLSQIISMRWQIYLTHILNPFKPIPPLTHKNRQSASKQKCFTTKQHWNFKCEVRDATVYCTYLCIHWHMRPWGGFNNQQQRGKIHRSHLLYKPTDGSAAVPVQKDW